MDEDPTAPPPKSPVDRIADAVFMHELARRIVREFGRASAFELAVLLLRHVVVHLRSKTRDERDREYIDALHISLTACLRAIAHSADELTRALAMAEHAEHAP